MSNKPVFPSLGMSPDVWGPIFWTTMHIVTLGYSENPSDQEQKSAVEFFRSLIHMLPCPICRTHYSQFMKDVPVEEHVGSRRDLIFWLFELHNKINVQLGKQPIEFKKFIENMRALSNSGHIQLPPSNYLSIISSFLVVGALGIGAYYAYMKYK
jgi:hypothetical protein